MLNRRTLLKVPALGLLGYLVPSGWAIAETRRRALVIGIDKYVIPGGKDTDEPGSTAGAQASASPQVQRNARFMDLDGAVNDAQLMFQILRSRFGFAEADIVLLENAQATHDRILHEFRAHLIDAAAPGDISFFYYAGHGSQVQNLASEEADQLDETIVPADSGAGAPDIRDKEMARLYRAAMDKHIQLTLVLDSCHSGGMSRGAWNGAGKTRFAKPDPTPINDPPDRDSATGKILPDATTRGMLFLAAAREDQTAGETSIVTRDASGARREMAHGAFTVALSQALQSQAASQSLDQIFARVQALMASSGAVQVPICGGIDRDIRGLLGQPTGMAASVTLAVDAVTGPGTVRLLGGSAMGLSSGCTLRRTTDPPVHVELTRVDLGVSDGRIIGSGGTQTRAGDLFRLETWVVPPQQTLAIYFSKDGPAAEAVLATARSLDSLAQQGRLEVVSELMTTTPPTHVFYWHSGGYFLERYPQIGGTISLGANPSADEIAHHLSDAGKVKLWPILPPDKHTVESLRLGAGTENPALQVVTDPGKSIYLLTGRLNNGVLEYSWIFKDTLIVAPDHARLPLRTDWTASASQLTGIAVRLARVYGWLNLNGPSGGDPSFPYQLVLEKTGKAGTTSTGPFRFGDNYKIYFRADPEALKQANASGGVAKRYVYVFIIDSNGDADCLFPRPANGNDGNQLPRTDPAEERIAATRHDHDIEITPPAGTDNYFLVASEEPLDPGVFKWAGVRGTNPNRGNAQRSADNPLVHLFTSTAEGKRGAQSAPAVPATWSIQSMAVRSGP